MATPDGFAKYFHDRSDLAEELYRTGSRHEARLLATVALDSLAAIWEHDEQRDAQAGDLRLAAFVQRFVGGDRSTRIAIVLMAQDMLRLAPSRFAAIAHRLLVARDVDLSQTERMEFRQSPLSHLDKDLAGLLLEEPLLGSEPKIAKLAERYTYPALLYRLVRCAVAHSLTSGMRTSDFSSGKPDSELGYFPAWVDGEAHPISIKFGLLSITEWVRVGAANYAADCARRGMKPADGFDANATSQQKLDALWTKAFKGG